MYFSYGPVQGGWLWYRRILATKTLYKTAEIRLMVWKGIFDTASEMVYCSFYDPILAHAYLSVPIFSIVLGNITIHIRSSDLLCKQTKNNYQL